MKLNDLYTELGKVEYDLLQYEKIIQLLLSKKNELLKGIHEELQCNENDDNTNISFDVGISNVIDESEIKE